MRDVMVILWQDSISVWTKKIVESYSLWVLLETRSDDE